MVEDKPHSIKGAAFFIPHNLEFISTKITHIVENQGFTLIYIIY